MSAQWIPAGLRAEVRHRARGRCEYCGVHEADVGAPHEPDHIVAEQHGGQTTVENLAYACYHCNRSGAELYGNRIQLYLPSVHEGMLGAAIHYWPKCDLPELLGRVFRHPT